jgi:putative methyltransferase (TIGR04325 family)
VGLGDRLPFELAQHVVPLLPHRLQRFTPSPSWADAEAASVGYGAVTPAASGSAYSLPTPLSGNDIATLAAFGVALAYVETSTSEVSVVDFGGFDGQHADLVQRAFPHVHFRWTVVELPSVVELVRERTRAGLNFLDNLETAMRGQVDVAFASASLNYVQAPATLLSDLVSGSQVTILSRLPLWPVAEHRTAIQHSQRQPEEISYPTWFFAERRFLKDVASNGEVLLDFVTPNDRAFFAGHYGRYRGLVIARRGQDCVVPT